MSRRSNGASALSKETQAFLDATTIVRALSRVAEDRFEQGKFDAAASAAINAIRWERYADGLYLSGGVSLQRTDSTRLWYLLAEVYGAMGERELAAKTVQKAASTIGELMERPLSDIIKESGGAGIQSNNALEPVGRFRRLVTGPSTLPGRRRAALFIGAVILGLLMFAAFRAQVAAKSMIDTSSEGVDYLNIAFGRTPENPSEDALLLAAERFARLRAQLDGWSWLIALSAAIPPAHDQFEAMDKMADLGSRLVAAPLASSNREQLAARGSIAGICASARRSESVDRNLLGQLDKNRTDMLLLVPGITGGACGGD
jgi:hypothetical protein